MNETDSPLQSTQDLATEGTQYRQSLDDQLTSVEQEARMVLPGIQALLGFQLIAVFNQGFQVNLTSDEQRIHLMALLMVAAATALVMAPAAYHREANHKVSKHFIQLSSRLLAWALVPLCLGTCFDIYLVSKVILKDQTASLVVSLSVFLFYSWLWFVMPKLLAQKTRNLPTRPLPKKPS